MFTKLKREKGIRPNPLDRHGRTHKQARNEKARQIRLCRDYLSGAKEQGLSEKSITVRKWRMLLAEWRAEPIWAIKEWQQHIWRRKRD